MGNLILALDRFQCGQNGTLGKLSINGEFFCYTLEDIDRQMEDGGEKVPGDTCIPRGMYEIIVNYSQRFRRDMPLLLNVPDFSGIRIHNGSFVADTEGCLLVGSKYATQADGSLILLNSKATFAKLYDVLDASYDRGQRIVIRVS